VTNTIKTLATGVDDIDLKCQGSLTADEARRPPAQLPTAVDQVIALANAVPDDPKSPEWRKPWNDFADSFYLWDAQIQDVLASAPFGASSAYQLGRGLGETSWSLDPTEPAGSSMSWTSLLASDRCLALTSLVVRLTPIAVTKDVSLCIKGALARWSERVTSKDFVSDDRSLVALRQQVALWRDLLLSGADPTALAPANASIRRISVLAPAIGSLWPMAAVGILSSALLGYAAYLMTTAHPSGITTTIITALGIFGFTGATVTAKASTAANNLAAHLRTAIQTDELVEATTLVPREAKGMQNSKSYRPGSISAPLTFDAISKDFSTRAIPPNNPQNQNAV
jgi:hypothetical protein